MNAEQLNSARLARWSQNGEARLTLESVGEWLHGIGFCRYLPTSPGAPPSASFLEAVVGRPAPMPSSGEISRARDLLARTLANGAAVPLKLGPSLAEQPDIVASPEAFRYIYALRGNRNFKGAPPIVGNDKVTPLALHCWQAIQAQGPLDASALQPILGQDITQAAILRALHELWSGLFAFPVVAANGQSAQWDLLPRRFPQPAAAGASTGHAEAQSAMVSLVLHAAVAAPEEEVLAALSPFAPLSKLREVIRGLGSMRQLDIVDIGGRAHVCLQGGLLPEMVAHLSEEQLAGPEAEPESVGDAGGDVARVLENGESAIEIEPESESAFHPRTQGSESSEKFVPKKFVPKNFVPNKFISRPPEVRQSSGKQVRSAVDKRNSRDFRERGTRERGLDRQRFQPRKSTAHGSGERPRRWEKPGERSSFQSGGFKPPEFRPAKPWRSKASDRGPAGAKPAKPWIKRATSAPNAPRPGGDQERPRPARWEKPREGAAQREDVGRFGTRNNRPYPAKSSRFQPDGFKPGRPKPWQKSAPAAGVERKGAKNYPDQAATIGERRPWKNRPTGPKSSRFTNSNFRSAGANSAQPRSGQRRNAVQKPWASKGAASRVGSAKSFAARASRTNDDAAPHTFGKSVGKFQRDAEDAKPRAKRAFSRNAEPEAAPSSGKPRRKDSEAASPSKPSGKRNAKPFWAKNPHGGKGSVAASRSNRPRVKSGGKKKHGKKK